MNFLLKLYNHIFLPKRKITFPTKILQSHFPLDRKITLDENSKKKMNTIVLYEFTTENTNEQH